ncbi:MAG TPA: EipA family protein [Xanthobacteraceae bacterium]|nr:EipA family protein [Xanthobacteraceae bacterium]
MRATPRTIALIILIGLASSIACPHVGFAQPAPGPYPQPAPGPYPQPAPGPYPQQSFTPGELVNTGQRFFGTVSRGLATVIENAASQWGLPNGYVLGEEAGGAFFGGLRYGEGMLYTKNAGDLKVYWQGPSIGWDFGGDGARTMMLVYSLPAVEAIYQRFAGIDGSAYFIGGFGMTALTANNVVLVPIRSGVGLRLGANVGYLKFTPVSTWNPF